MPKLSRERLSEYDREIAEIVALADEEMAERLLVLVSDFRRATNGPDRKRCRDRLAEAYRAIVAESQSACFALADELYRETALSEGLISTAPAAHAPMTREEAVERVRSLASMIFQGAWDDEKVLRNLRATGRAAVEEAPNAAMAENAARCAALQKSLRMAIVPADAEACGFCFARSSRGFYWKPAEVAAESCAGSHPGCRCRLVPGFQGQTEVEGFDFAAMEERWRQCARTVGTDSEASGDELSRLVQAECETRDPEWLWYGHEPKANYIKPREQLESHEKATIDNLLQNGIAPTVLLEDGDAPANIDLEINGALWEMKNAGDGKHSIEDRLRDAAKKWEKLHLKEPVRVVMTNEGGSRTVDGSVDEIKKRMRYADEVLYVHRDGTMRRIRK